MKAGSENDFEVLCPNYLLRVSLWTPEKAQ